MTQTQDKLRRDNVKNQREAIETHEMIGKGVRTLIEEFGGMLPENIPPAEHIKKVAKRLKTSKPRLALEAKDAAGIIASPETQDSN
jgi:DNA-damage-inducible protein D